MKHCSKIKFTVLRVVHIGWSENNLSYSLHKPSRRNFKRNKIYAPEIDSLWEADLAFVQDVAKVNDGVNYLLVVINVFSKFLWVRPMKNKTACSLVQAFDSILSEKRKPEKLRTDKGTEFINESFQQYLKKQGIQFYMATNEPKAAVVERVNGTLNLNFIAILRVSILYTILTSCKIL